MSLSRCVKRPACAKCAAQLAQVVHAQMGQIGDALPGKAHGAGGGVQARAVAAGAGRLRPNPPPLGWQSRFRGPGCLRPVGCRRTPLRWSFLSCTPVPTQSGHQPVLAVVAEQARVQLGIAGGAHRAGALGGEGLHAAHATAVATRPQRGGHSVDAVQHLHHALAQLQRLGQVLAQRGPRRRR